MHSKVYDTDRRRNMENKSVENTTLSPVFPLGEIFNSDSFNAPVHLAWLVSPDSPLNCPVCNVSFEAGVRNNWHVHPGGQILLVTAGKGYYQEYGKPARIIQKGDVVEIPANVKHWHGAGKCSSMSHISIETNRDKGSVEWLEALSQAEYDALPE